MKSLLYLFPLCCLWIVAGCVQEESHSQCGIACGEGESVIEILENRQGKIVHIQNLEQNLDYWFIDIDQNYFDKEGYSKSNETTLIPCNPNQNFTNGSRVVVSGKRLNCCNLITWPQLRYSWGCKFEITSIESIND
ncbi:hypothetical protein [Algoriphagus vanfongensis]|uniref:hypothetical protein n=1 Tax=Algoriphagus vanfongensis TaxID=426371 RepID=UPI0012F9C20C|nr:hypothetical protein [Algoriphagus vanfongensis]